MSLAKSKHSNHKFIKDLRFIGIAHYLKDSHQWPLTVDTITTALPTRHDSTSKFAAICSSLQSDTPHQNVMRR